MFPRALPKSLLALVATAVITGTLAWSAPPSPAYAGTSAGLLIDPPVEVKVGTENRDRLVIHVEGSGFSGAAPGLDVALTPSGYVSSASSDAFIAKVSIAKGHPTWKVDLELDHDQIAELDPTRTYQILTMRGGHRDLYDISQTVQKAVDLDFDKLAQPAPKKKSARRRTSSPSPSPSTSRSGSGSGSGSSSGSGSAGGGSSAGSGSGATSGSGSAAKAPAAAATQAPTKKPWEAPSEAPTAQGLSLGNADGFEAGGTVTASATGFKPHEDHIKVVVYSSPIVLSTSVRADAHGKATWSGRLPKDIEIGRHILTFQGSVDRGVEFTVTGVPSDGECKDGGCSAAPTPAPSAAGSDSDDKPMISPMTWMIIAIMVIVALLAGAVALMVARRQGSDDWNDYEPLRSYGPPEPAYEEPYRPRAAESFAPPAQRSGPPPMPSERFRAQQPVPRQPAQRWSPPPQ